MYQKPAYNMQLEEEKIKRKEKGENDFIST